jgi:hypothetical protein
MKLKKMQKWQLYDKSTKEKIIINDLIEYSTINNIKYKTVYAWKYQIINGQPRLQKV